MRFFRAANILTRQRKATKANKENNAPNNASALDVHFKKVDDNLYIKRIHGSGGSNDKSKVNENTVTVQTGVRSLEGQRLGKNHSQASLKGGNNSDNTDHLEVKLNNLIT